MRASLLLVLLACGPARQDAVTVVAPPPTRDCPAGTVFNGVDCAQLLSHASGIDASAPVVATTVDAPPLLDEARELRAFSKHPRSSALLVTEIQALESLKNATNQNAPDYPQLVRRLAEDYSELSYTGSRDARKHAIAEYTLLKNSFPSYAQIDEVLYYLGYTHELDGEMNSARKTYYELIQKQPNSKYIPYAYYAFGEMFYNEAKSDPSKWQLAQQAFQEVFKFAQSPIQPWGMLRLGQTAEAMGDHAKAQALFAKLRSLYPQSQAVAQIP